nr:unnamed protein product [Callosobruchus analis]
MPFQYKPREVISRRKKVCEKELRNAIDEVKGGASIRQTSIKYGIDRSTLRRYRLNEEKLKKFEQKNSQYKQSQIFNTSEEKLLIEYLLTCSKMHYGLTRKQTIQLAFEFAKANSKKNKYNSVMSNWMLSNPGKTVTIYNISGFVKTVMSQTFSHDNILSGFKKAGIHPFNPDVFSDEDFLCSAVTAPENVETVPVQDDTSVLRENIEGLSGESSSTSSEIVLPAMIRSYPKAPPRKMFRRGRQPGKTKILTITPEKENIHIGCPTEISTASTSCEVMEHTQVIGSTKMQKVDHVKRTVFKQSDNEQVIKNNQKEKENLEAREKKIRKKKVVKVVHKKARRRKKVLNDDSSETECEDENISYADSSSDEDFEKNLEMDSRWYCFVCQSEEIMDMRLCGSCRRYVHVICVGLTKNDTGVFICHECDET